MNATIRMSMTSVNEKCETLKKSRMGSKEEFTRLHLSLGASEIDQRHKSRERVRHCGDVAHRGDVMHAYDVRSMNDRCGDGRRGAPDSLSCGPVEDFSDEGLSRSADQERKAEGREPPEIANYLQILANGLPEADAGIQDDLLGADTTVSSPGNRLAGPRLDLREDVGSGWDVLHGPRLTARMHQDQRGATAGHDLRERRCPQGRHVVDERRTPVERRFGHLGLSRIDGDGERVIRELVEDGNDAVELLSETDALGTRARRFGAHVQNVSALFGNP